MSTIDQPCYTLISLPTASVGMESSNEQQLKEDLENGKPHEKSEALKRVIGMIINGDKFTSMQSMLMNVIRFVMPVPDNRLKKLLLIFWEVVPKYTADGKLMHEMILVCDAYRKDLQHPNEFVRGSTLRFLCKLKEPELLEPLMPAIRQCLEHRHSYVRRNAVLAIFTIFKNFPFLIPDAPELVATYLEGEQDASCKRNAFMMLIHVDQDRALKYLATCIDQVHSFGDILQLVIVELIYKVCHANPTERSRFIRCVYNLLQSSSPSVRYEAACTLITLSNAPTAVRAVASCYIELILKESDNNVKLIVLDRLIAMRDHHERVLQDQVMDIMRILNTSDSLVRIKTLDLVNDLVSTRTIEEVINLVKKEYSRLYGTSDKASNNGDPKYKQMLMRVTQSMTLKFPEQALPILLPVFGEALTDPVSKIFGRQGLRLLREVCVRFPQLRSVVLEKVYENFGQIQHSIVFRYAVYLIAEFSESLEEIQTFMALVHRVMGDLPYAAKERDRLSGLEEEEKSALSSDRDPTLEKSAPKLTADGTYIMHTALTASDGKKESSKNKRKILRPPLLQVILAPDFNLAVYMSNVLVKMFARVNSIAAEDHRQCNKFNAECMLIISSLYQLAHSQDLFLGNDSPVNPDFMERMLVCLKALSERDPDVLAAFTERSREGLKVLIDVGDSARRQASKSRNGTAARRHVQPDQPIRFLQLSSTPELGDIEDRFDATLSKALGGSVTQSDDMLASSKLSKVTQLTGFSDPIYAEAYVNVNQYDILLDVLIVNQTSDTLQNLTVELATLGDLRLVEKPSPITLAPRDFANIKAHVKVSSSENGIIFGNIVYDVRGASGESTVIVLNDIHIDIIEYIFPSNCMKEEFRLMWCEYEWENKVTVNTPITELREFLKHMENCTRLKCQQADSEMQGECGYLSVTLYGKTVFGESIIANMCLEKPLGENTRIIGHIRLRAKSQGLAMTMGEIITQSMKKHPGK